MNTQGQISPVAVAIDGPSGAGKSTIAKILAARLGFIYVDTGALYRAVGLSALRYEVDISNHAAIEDFLKELRIDMKYCDGDQRVFANGQDVTDGIRTPEVSSAASTVSAVPAVRAFLFSLQQNMAKTYSVIMDGRDIGTVVLPDAKVKVFLTASPQARAKRRYDELIEKGMNVTFESVLNDMIERDKRDSERATAPLKPAHDAVLVDTTDMSLEESVECIRSIVEEAMQ